jgi:Beta-glucan synthesis-associated protein SKN1/KRE6/Sbg1
VSEDIDQYHHQHRQGLNVTTDTTTSSVVPASSRARCLCASATGKPTEAVEKLSPGSAVPEQCSRPSTCTIFPGPHSFAVVELEWTLLYPQPGLWPASKRTSSKQRAQNKCGAPSFSAIQSTIEQEQCSDGRGDWSDWYSLWPIFSQYPFLSSSGTSKIDARDQYHTNPAPRNTGVYGNGRFSNAPSDASISTNEYQHQQYQQYQQAQQYQAPPQVPVAQRTTTVPAYMWDKEPDLDDALHAPDPKRDNSWTPFSWRGWVNVLGIFVLLSGLLTLFIGFPLHDYVEKSRRAAWPGYNIGGVNASGQIPSLPGMRKPIDPDTPVDAYDRTGNDGYKYKLVFSDEFNLDGRTFYPGDDPYWEAVNLHYWYAPFHCFQERCSLSIAGQRETWSGTIRSRSRQRTGSLSSPLIKDSTTISASLAVSWTQLLVDCITKKILGMVSSWNKICFTTGYIETSVSLPGNPRTSGLWPGLLISSLTFLLLTRRVSFLSGVDDGQPGPRWVWCNYRRDLALQLRYL